MIHVVYEDRPDPFACARSSGTRRNRAVRPAHAHHPKVIYHGADAAKAVELLTAGAPRDSVILGSGALAGLDPVSELKQ